MEYIINPINGEKYSIHDVNGRNLLKMYLLTYKSGGKFSLLDLLPWISQKNTLSNPAKPDTPNDIKRRSEELTNVPNDIGLPFTQKPFKMNKSVVKRKLKKERQKKKHLIIPDENNPFQLNYETSPTRQHNTKWVGNYRSKLVLKYINKKKRREVFFFYFFKLNTSFVYVG